MRKKATMALLPAATIMMTPHAWGLDFPEGRYEITSAFKWPGMPMQPPPTTITECITQKDPVPNQQIQNDDCKITAIRTVSNNVPGRWNATSGLKDENQR